MLCVSYVQICMPSNGNSGNASALTAQPSYGITSLVGNSLQTLSYIASNVPTPRSTSIIGNFSNGAPITSPCGCNFYYGGFNKSNRV